MVSLDELRKLIVSHAGCADLGIDGLLLSSRDEPIAPIPGPVLMIVAEGAIRVVFGDRTYEYCAGQYLVASIDLPVIGHYVQASLSERFVGLGLTFEPEDIAALLLEAGSDTQNRRDLAAGLRPGLAVSDVSSELLDSAVRLLRLLDHRTDLPVLAPIVKKEILWRLITGEQGATVRQLGLADSRLTHIRRAIQWIREHYTETLHIEDLARMAGMSTASFHRHFRAVTAMTPVQFQKQIRLHEARQLLLSEAHDVATTGYLVGYDSPSQFSREYRRLFGAPPGQDAARLRESRAAAE